MTQPDRRQGARAALDVEQHHLDMRRVVFHFMRRLPCELHQQTGRRIVEGDLQRLHRLGTAGAEIAGAVHDIIEQRHHATKQMLRGFGWLQADRRAGEQDIVEFGFEPLHLRAQGRLRHAAQPRCGAQAALLHHRCKILQLPEIHPLDPSATGV